MRYLTTVNEEHWDFQLTEVFHRSIRRVSSQRPQTKNANLGLRLTFETSLLVCKINPSVLKGSK